MSELFEKLAICRSNILNELGVSTNLPSPLERLVLEAVGSIDAVLNVHRVYLGTDRAEMTSPVANDGATQVIQGPPTPA